MKENSASKLAVTGNTKKKKRKYGKLIALLAVLLVLAVVIAVFLPKLLADDTVSARITTYNVSEVTYGNVSTTISGSGTLTSITRETVTAGALVTEDTSDDDASDEETADDGTATAAELSAPAELWSGSVSTLQYTVGDSLSEGDVLATVLLEDESELELIAPYDCVVLENYLAEGDSVTSQTGIAMLMGKDGFTLELSVEEQNIATVALGQEAEITVDAVSGDFSGEVTDISYNGSASGSVTSFKIEVTVDYADGIYPGMSVSAEIVIEDSGEGLLVPVDAVLTSGDTNYVYLAPADAVLGSYYEESALTLTDLTKVTVETGMSDGSYLLIECDDLAEGDLIIIPTITSTLTGSESESNDSTFGGMGGFGGFGGGQMPDGTGFGNFNPGDMPQGGFPGMGS